MLNMIVVRKSCPQHHLSRFGIFQLYNWSTITLFSHEMMHIIKKDRQLPLNLKWSSFIKVVNPEKYHL